jgi:hypothetical protein
MHRRDRIRATTARAHRGGGKGKRLHRTTNISNRFLTDLAGSNVWQHAQEGIRFEILVAAPFFVP